VQEVGSVLNSAHLLSSLLGGERKAHRLR